MPDTTIITSEFVDGRLAPLMKEPAAHDNSKHFQVKPDNKAEAGSNNPGNSARTYETDKQ
jgi:hypothetical protein